MFFHIFNKSLENIYFKAPIPLFSFPKRNAHADGRATLQESLGGKLRDFHRKPPYVLAVPPCMKVWRFTVDAHKPQEHAVWRTAVSGFRAREHETPRGAAESNLKTFTVKHNRMVNNRQDGNKQRNKQLFWFWMPGLWLII